MTLFETITSGVLRKERLDSHVTAFEWFLVHMGWSLEINQKKNELTANEKKINFMV